MSYKKAEALLNRQIHPKLISGVKMRQVVIKKAKSISIDQKQLVEGLIKKTLPKLAKKVNLYTKRKGEVLLFEDGILVKGQKYHRKSKNRPAKSKKGHKKRPSTDIALCPNKDGSSTFIIGGMGQEFVPLPQAVKGHMIAEFGSSQSVLKLISITDGASQIKTHYKAAFGIEPIRILDWYHLKKKVNELCIQICCTKDLRQIAVKAILKKLWNGQVKQAVQYLEEEVKVRNNAKYVELINYLNKHSLAIIDYQSRKDIDKIIGSGCMESGVKQAVAIRQKAKGMSWVPDGSSALAILTVQQMNDNWDNLWSFNSN